MSEMGHNVGGVNRAELMSFIERVEKIEGDVRDMNSDKSDVYKEAKSRGYDDKVLKKIIAMRRMDPDKRREQEEILDLYLTSIGMVD
jgi:uncharacterized protein (UPF0335 family)